ncbi:DUF2304 domain-containing protein [Floricoccus penangensis]|uniref:DUF2304 domain-containing protein n=1 Tax=Floricoccus penangensis TaxID=1859475 RepID=A0A9Q5JIV9_9LACT|nr:DUF2304 domain-containing protein [Floricoccus penangensis]OFI47930.1 hypothetical protein BG262_08030 [Floricoccus penangensis]URZ87766.1 DUF2304 family protein [Floricoccus penangensis]
MSVLLRVEMIVLALAIFYYIVKMVNKNAFSLRRSAPWLIVGLGIIFIALFPDVVSLAAHQLGFALTMNFLLFVGLVFVFVLELMKTSSDTKKDQQIKVLIQEVSLLKKEVEKND